MPRRCIIDADTWTDTTTLTTKPASLMSPLHHHHRHHYPATILSLVLIKHLLYPLHFFLPRAPNKGENRQPADDKHNHKFQTLGVHASSFDFHGYLHFGASRSGVTIRSARQRSIIFGGNSRAIPRSVLCPGKRERTTIIA